MTRPLQMLLSIALLLPLALTACAHVVPDGKTYKLRPHGACTAALCGDDNPCCNGCGFERWVLQDHEDVEIVGDLPTCEMDGCGSCGFTLEATGAIKDGKLHVVEVTQVPVAAPAAKPALGSADTDEPERVSDGIVLRPSALCTKMACAADNPCCNSCRLSGFRTSMYNAEVRFGGEAPKVQLDGCGQISAVNEQSGARHGYFLTATGSWEGEVFVVTSWSASEEGLSAPSE